MTLNVTPAFVFDKLVEARGDSARYGVSVPIPSRGVELTTLLETYLLISLAKIADAKTILQIGTWKGATARNLAHNVPGAEIHTVDLNMGLSRDSFDAFPQIHAHEGHSNVIDLGAPAFDFAFIDGGHDYTTVKVDTERTCALMNKGGIVAWHDYRCPQWPGVTEYLDSKSIPPLGMRDLYYVEGTFLVFAFF